MVCLQVSPPSSLAFFPESGGGFALVEPPLLREKCKRILLPPRGGRPLALISSTKTSRARLPLFTRDDSPIEGWRLA